MTPPFWNWFRSTAKSHPAGDEYRLQFSTFGGGRGYAVHRLSDGTGIRWQALPRDEGLEAHELEDTRPDSDAFQHPGFDPGARLTLMPEEWDRVAVYDAGGDQLAGYLPEDRSPAIARRLLAGEGITCISLWEKLNHGRRVALRVLLVDKDAPVRLPRP